jgi:hypothetical protein
MSGHAVTQEAPAQADHRLEWQPPTRPEWVQRINEEAIAWRSSRWFRSTRPHC